MRRLIALASAAVLTVGSAATIHAGGPKGNHGNASVASTLGVVLVTDKDANGVPNWGDQITFDVSTAQAWNEVEMMCAQNGTVVYGAVWPLTSILTLSSTAWQGGSADCSAALLAFDGRKTDVLASTNFTVGQ